jgi:hypothetical protein
MYRIANTIGILPTNKMNRNNINGLPVNRSERNTLGALPVDFSLDDLRRELTSFGDTTGFTGDMDDLANEFGGNTNKNLTDSLKSGPVMIPLILWVLSLFLASKYSEKMGIVLNLNEFERNELIIGSFLMLMIMGIIRPMLLGQPINFAMAIILASFYSMWYLLTYSTINYANKDRLKNLVYR